MVIRQLSVLFLKFYFVIASLINSNDYAENDTCVTWEKEHLVQSSEIHGYNLTFIFLKIDSLDDVNVNLTSCQTGYENNIDILKVYATRKIFLVNSFDYDHLIDLFKISLYKIKPLTDWPQSIIFQNILGFNQKTDDISSRIQSKNAIFIDMTNVNFDFYQNEILIREDSCLPSSFSNTSGFFGAIKQLSLVSGVNYENKICPYVFDRTQLEYLEFFQITNSLIFMNRLEFLSINQSTNEIQTDSLWRLKLSVAFEKISLRNVDKHAFKSLTHLILSGYVDDIDGEIFMYLKKIRLIQIAIENFSQFFHASATRWMSHLNSNLNINVNNPIDVGMNVKSIIAVEFLDEAQSLKKSYRYPDEDICLFRQFPHTRLVVPVIVLDEAIEKCSCTLLWLLQYTRHFIDKADFHYFKDVRAEYLIENLTAKNICLKDRNFALNVAKCNFTEKFKNCLLNETHITDTFLHFNGNLSLFYLFKWLQYIIEVYFQPFFCVFGLITNFLSIKVIRNRRHVKHFKNPMYKHILFNAWFNVSLCIIYSFSLINICIFPKSSFCSSVLKYETSQYFKIYGIFFMGNSLRLCCNFSYIFFSVSRGVLSTSSRESKLRHWFEHLNTRIFYSSLFALTVCFSIFKVFEYKPSEIYNTFEKDFPYNAYDLKFCEKFLINEPMIYSPVKCRLMWSMNLVNNILNNVIFLFLSLIIDVVMIRFSRSLIRQKMILNSPQLKEAIKFKEELNKMIVVNGELYFVSHFPEFFVTLMLIVFKSRFVEFCYVAFSCSELIEMAQRFHLIPIAWQFFILYHFDHNFIKSFADLKMHLFRKKNVTLNDSRNSNKNN
jgi:hypothetical protein